MSWWDQVEAGSRERLFLSSGAFKTYTNLWEPGDSHPIIDEREGHGWSQCKVV
jgi:hypothetical protein